MRNVTESKLQIRFGGAKIDGIVVTLRNFTVNTQQLSKLRTRTRDAYTRMSVDGKGDDLQKPYASLFHFLRRRDIYT